MEIFRRRQKRQLEDDDVNQDDFRSKKRFLPAEFMHGMNDLNLLSPRAGSLSDSASSRHTSFTAGYSPVGRTTSFHGFGVGSPVFVGGVQSGQSPPSYQVGTPSPSVTSAVFPAVHGDDQHSTQSSWTVAGDSPSTERLFAACQGSATSSSSTLHSDACLRLLDDPLPWGVKIPCEKVAQVHAEAVPMEELAVAPPVVVPSDSCTALVPYVDRQEQVLQSLMDTPRRLFDVKLIDRLQAKRLDTLRRILEAQESCMFDEGEAEQEEEKAVKEVLVEGRYDVPEPDSDADADADDSGGSWFSVRDTHMEVD